MMMAMTTSRFVTAPNRYVTAADGVTYAYRMLEQPGTTPLVLLQHFTGTMDSWDPLLVDALAAERTVVVFDNAGVGASGGRTPDTVDQMTIDAEAVIVALGLGEVDLLGFSLGGFIAQAMAARNKVPVRRIVAAGSAPRGGEEHLMQVVGEAFAAQAPDVRLPLFFTPSARSQAAGRGFVARAASRTVERDPESGDDITQAQAKAIIGWCADKTDGDALLKSIAQPALVVHGRDDTMFPASNAYAMARAMPDASLIIYPDAGHGALFQHATLFASHVDLFLNA
jgi:pimeloyl-ACP methyl ester carboxylesterase